MNFPSSARIYLFLEKIIGMKDGLLHPPEDAPSDGEFHIEGFPEMLFH